MTDTKIEVHKTITTIFMVPSLHIPKDALKNNGFLNGFIKDKTRDIEYEDAIYLLFKPTDIDKFREFLDNEYERTQQIIDDYDHPNGFVVVVYKLDIKYAVDFMLIRMGKYSKTSKLFQKEFPDKIRIFRDGKTREEASLQYRIFNRTEDLTKYWEEKLGEPFDTYELWKGFEIEEETLTEEKLKEYEQQ